jgi:hypothetical protein
MTTFSLYIDMPSLCCILMVRFVALAVELFQQLFLKCFIELMVCTFWTSGC